MNYQHILKNTRVCVIGLGYVGLPLAAGFARETKVYGYDVSHQRVKDLAKGIDVNLDFTKEQLRQAHLEISTDPSIINKANVIIICVPTPLKENTTQPDLRLLEDATKTVGKYMNKNSLVVFESTVWPGATEEICLPLLEQHSGMKLDKDFGLGYSPERINPGDKTHTIESVVKVVAGHTSECAKTLASLYKRVAKNGVFIATNIAVAEAAKIIENTQRDVNIALMNEFSLICDRLGISTYDVLDAARTKWNFLDFYPGLVGGHCIGVDPYYLAHRAQQLGLTPKIILAGRSLNGFMAEHVAHKMMYELQASGKKPADCSILVMGLTFKENVPDIRNSKAKEVIDTLRKYHCRIVAVEPLIDREIAKHEFGVELAEFSHLQETFDGIMIINKHHAFHDIPLRSFLRLLKEPGVVIDLKRMLPQLQDYTRYLTL